MQTGHSKFALRLRLCGVLTILFAASSLPCSAQEPYVANDAVLKVFETREIPSKSSGVILSSNIREGSLVSAGDLLLEIDSRLAKLNVEKLQAEEQIAAEEAASTVEIEFMKRSIEVAKAELSRGLQSNRRLPGAVPKSEIDQLALIAERAIAEKKKTAFDMQMKQMQTKIRGLELKIGQRQWLDHQIKTPLSGKVVEVYKRAGEWVDRSEAVAKIVQLDKLKTEIKIPASIAVDQLEGTQAIFTPDLSSIAGEKFDGIVIFVNPEANPVNQTMRVWIEIDNKELKLVPGLVGTIELLRKKPTVKTKNENAATTPASH